MHEATSAGSWGPRGLQRNVRSTVATGLAAMAAVLAAASSVAETIAKELRLSLDEEVDLPPRATDVARRAEPVTSAAVNGGEAVDADGPTVRIVDASARAGGPRGGRAAEAAGGSDTATLHGAAEGDSNGPQARPSTAPPTGPSPWVDDVAAEVAGGTVRDAVERLPSLTPTQLRALERHERANRARVTLLRAVGEELTRRG